MQLLNIFSNKPAVKTVDSVLSAFNQQIADLETINATSLSAANTARELAESSLQRATQAEQEAARALTVANKIRNLIQL